MELWKALLIFDQQNPQESKPLSPVYKPVQKVEPVPKKDFNFFDDFNEAKKTERTARTEQPRYSDLNPKNAPEPLHSFRHNDFVKVNRSYLTDPPEFNHTKTISPERNLKDATFRTRSVAMPVSEYNEAIRKPWEANSLALDLSSLQTIREPRPEPIPYTDHQKYHHDEDPGYQTVPDYSREVSMVPSDVSLPNSEPYPGSKSRRTRRGRSKKRRYVYVPSRDDAIIELVEDSQDSDSETPADRPRRVHGKPPKAPKHQPRDKPHPEMRFPRDHKRPTREHKMPRQQRRSPRDRRPRSKDRRPRPRDRRSRSRERRPHSRDIDRSPRDHRRPVIDYSRPNRVYGRPPRSVKPVRYNSEPPTDRGPPMDDRRKGMHQRGRSASPRGNWTSKKDQKPKRSRIPVRRNQRSSSESSDSSSSENRRGSQKSKQRHKLRQRSTSRKRRDASRENPTLKRQSRRTKVPLNSDRFVSVPSRGTSANNKASRSSHNRISSKPVKVEHGSGFVNKDNSIQFTDHYDPNTRRGSHVTDRDEAEEQSESVDSSTESDDDSYSDSESEPTQQGSEGDDDTGTTEGDGSPRKGRRGGRRFEDGTDVLNSVNPGEHRQGRRVAFFNFKEKSNPPAIESVNKQRFPYFESLLTHLTDKLQIDKGAHFIYYYEWPKLIKITSVDDFEHEGSYIVASNALKKTNLEAVYGKFGPNQWQNGRTKHNEVQQPVQQPVQRKPPQSGHDSNGNMSGLRRRPLTVTLISNTTGKARSCILNTNAHFEDLMAGTITDVTPLDFPPATYLYSFNRGVVGKEIRSMSQLSRDHRNNDTFLVCGTEGLSAPGYYFNDMFRGRYRYPVDMAEVIRSPRSSGVGNGLPPPERRVVKIQGRRREFYQSSVYDGEEELGQPTRKLMLDWVYGYRGSDRHKNLEILHGGELVYFVAHVVVLYDSNRHLQRFYTDHNEDITCIDNAFSLAVHPNQKSIATGQMSGRGSDHGAHIRIWDVDTLETWRVLGKGFFQNGIVAIDFSDRLNRHRLSSDFMLAIDESFRHTLSIWDIEQGERLTKTTTNTETVTGACFHPYAEDILITYGRQHLYFFTLDWDYTHNKVNKILRDKLSGFSEPEDAEKDDIPTHLTALTFTVNGDVVTGDSNGLLMLWQREGDNVFNLRESSDSHSHSSAVTSLTPYDGFVMSGAGQDIFLWNIDVNGLTQPERHEVNIKGNIQTLVPHPYRAEGAPMYIGTDKNCIYEGLLHNEFSPIAQGHSGESACIAVHPVEPMFVTAGSGRVMKWSAACHTCQWDVKMKGEKCSAVAIDLNDRLVAVGTKSGKVTMLDYDDWGREQHTLSISGKKINSVAFSPDGFKLAVAVDEGNINICSVDKGVMERTHTTTHVHGLSMNNIDWSLDGRIIQTSSADFQVFFWNVERKPKLIPGNKLRDADFLTHKSLVSGSILGPWQHLDTGETIKAVDRTNLQQKELLVTGDSAGRLRLYKYPCASPESEFRGIRRYSGAINSAVFSGDDIFVFSSASTSNKGELKNHLGVMQWAVVDADCQVLPDHFYSDFCDHEFAHHYDPSKPNDISYRRKHHRIYNPNHPDYPRHYPHHLHHPHHPHYQHQHHPQHPNYLHLPRHLRPNYYQTPYYPQNHPYYKRYQ